MGCHHADPAPAAALVQRYGGVEVRSDVQDRLSLKRADIAGCCVQQRLANPGSPMIARNQQTSHDRKLAVLGLQFPCRQLHDRRRAQGIHTHVANDVSLADRNECGERLWGLDESSEVARHARRITVRHWLERRGTSSPRRNCNSQTSVHTSHSSSRSSPPVSTVDEFVKGYAHTVQQLVAPSEQFLALIIDQAAELDL